MIIKLSPLLVLLVVAGCGQATEEDPSRSALSDGSVIVYEFHDSSVPPEYHRSVTLTASKDETRIVIDSYGDVLAEESVPTPAATWTLMSETIGQVSGLAVTNTADGCTGGTSVELTVTTGDTQIVDLDPEFCAGSNEGVDEAIDGWIAPIRDLFAPTDVLAPETS
jgi:hypothetical protein